ncbi:MAG: class I SAM-dependent methyltransferase [Planctomycetota bacterium]|jgi:SAM-dependent methyltransferase
MSKSEHWDSVYGSKADTEMSWYQPHLETSLRLIRDCGVPAGGSVIDVGSGASTLVDDLLDAGSTEVTVLDVSQAAIDGARARLGSRATSVSWIVGDILSTGLPAARYDLWHDRAVFHFLTSEDERARYVRTLRAALKGQGHLVIATFGPAGPTRCSGLDVARHSAESLSGALGSEFELVAAEPELHRTPSGTEQSFLYCRFRRH